MREFSGMKMIKRCHDPIPMKSILNLKFRQYDVQIYTLPFKSLKTSYYFHTKYQFWVEFLHILIGSILIKTLSTGFAVQLFCSFY